MSVRILIGDVMDRLRDLPDESVNCAVTSPPYWGLRDYGVPGQLGLEPTLPEHLDAMVAVFREVRRVLRADGTLWVNYGDCYATTPTGRKAEEVNALGADDLTFRDKPFSTVGGVLKPKDLCMVPNRLAIALQEDGWWVRSEIIWAKPNPMPESVTDRPATSHEKIFLLSKSAKYFYDAEAVRAPAAHPDGPNAPEKIKSPHGQGYTRRAKGGARKYEGAENGSGVHPPHKGLEKARQDYKRRNRGKTSRRTGENNQSTVDQAPRGEGRNLRNVWEIATKPFAEAHFATFPPKLVRPCILAGCPEGGTVLDPFGGSGTTGLVADQLGRNAILIELNPEYAEMARRRIKSDAPLFAEVDHKTNGEAA